MSGLIGVPNTGTFPWEWVSASHNLTLPPKTGWVFVGGALVYEARKMIADHMMEKGADWLFFLDADVIPPPDTILRLLAYNLPIVGGLVYHRGPPYRPLAYTQCDIDESGRPVLAQVTDYPEDRLVEVAGLGTGCLLIRREVFETVKKPWFFPLPVMGEDLAFCLRARKAGFKIHLDTSIKCGHVNYRQITEVDFKNFKEV